MCLTDVNVRVSRFLVAFAIFIILLSAISLGVTPPNPISQIKLLQETDNPQDEHSHINRDMITTYPLFKVDINQLHTGNQWTNDEKITYAYSSADRLAESFYYGWVNDNWVPLYWSICSYDINGNLLAKTFYYNDQGQFSYSGRSLNSYDVNGNLIENILQTYENNDWVNNWIFSYSYNEDNLLIEELRGYWHPGLTDWYFYEKVTSAYDLNNNLSIRIYYTDFEPASEWENSREFTYTYDENSNLIERTMRQWSGDQWNNTTKETYTYSVNSNLLERLDQTWSVDQWTTLQRETYDYDENDWLIEQVYQFWETDYWRNIFMYNYVYNADGNQVECINRYWDSYSYTWIDSTKAISTYNCGEFNGDMTVNLIDIAFLISYLYADGPAPPSLENADVNSDNQVNLLDITFLIGFIYMNGSDPLCQ